MQRLTPDELSAWLAEPTDCHPILLDVREEWEYELGHLPGSVLLPLGQLSADELETLDLQPDQPIVAICHHGVRSRMAMQLLAHYGYTKVYDLIGGTDAWSVEIDPTLRRY
ncbi:MAG: rhodanese-like domain-containing protein [Lautropia sp.]|nr:rhodanese-like domain-containing protein [Lautropia sp.]